MLRYVLPSIVIVAVSAGAYPSGSGYSSGALRAAGYSTGGGALRAVRVAEVASAPIYAPAPARAVYAPAGYSNARAVRGYSNGYGPGYAVPASIHTTHNIEYRDVPSSGYIEPATVEVGASAIPVNIFFRSASSVLNVKQVHEGAQGTFHQSQSEDEPHRLVHQVTKPIYQEVREIVTPYRRIVQEIKPVQEHVNTIVARGERQTVLADNTGSFVPAANGGLVGTVTSAVLGPNIDDVGQVQQVIEQQQIADFDGGHVSSDVGAIGGANYLTGNVDNYAPVSNVGVVENVVENVVPVAEEVQQQISADGY